MHGVGGPSTGGGGGKGDDLMQVKVAFFRKYVAFFSLPKRFAENQNLREN